MKSFGVTTQMKATEQYFPVTLFIMLYRVVLNFESANKILKCGCSNQSSTIIMLWKVLLTLSLWIGTYF